MAITEEIDLTIESDFAGDDDITLKPWAVQQRERNSFWTTGGIPITIGLISHVNFENTIFFEDGMQREKIVFDLVDSHVNILGRSETALSILAEYDPYAVYFWEAGISCDYCGIELNVLNSDGHSLCQRCHVRELPPMKIN